MSLMRYAPLPFYDETDATTKTKLYAFGKILEADYYIDLTLDPIGSASKRGTAAVVATLKFESFLRARPVIDFMTSLNAVSEVALDGWVVKADRVSTRHARWQYLGLDQEVAPGTHTITISYETDLRVGGNSFMRPQDPGVYWHFRMSDAGHEPVDPEDSHFLGRYLPTNAEFDAHPRTIRLHFNKIGGRSKELVLFTNASVNGSPGGPQRLAPETEHWIRFPDEFRSSSVFFYLADPDKVAIDSLKLPFANPARQVTLFGPKDTENDGDYESRPNKYLRRVWRAAQQLNRDFGAFPTEHVTLFAGRQGMEYAGAAEISGGNVLHELFHLYFARWIVPTDGASGWWDEALAHWYVSGQTRYPEPGDEGASLGVASPYRRWTSRKARTIGAIFIGHLDHLVRDRGGMIAFLAHLASSTDITPLDSRDLQTALETWSGRSLKREFDRYVWGTEPVA